MIIFVAPEALINVPFQSKLPLKFKAFKDEDEKGPFKFFLEGFYL